MIRDGLWLPLDKLHIQLNDSVNNKDYGVALADFATLGNDWTRVEIPLGEFANRGVDLQHFLSLRLFFGPNASVDLAVNEINFSGACCSARNTAPAPSAATAI